jgi:hypothetical protein
VKDITVDKYNISKLWARNVFLEIRKEKEGRACVLKEQFRD